MNTKQRNEGKSRFGHPKRENQRAEQNDQEVGKVDEPDFKIETIQKACKASGFFSDCQFNGGQANPNSVMHSFKQAEVQLCPEQRTQRLKEIMCCHISFEQRKKRAMY